MIVSFLAHLLISAALLMVVANVVGGFEVDDWGSAFVAALVLGIVNAFVRPLIILLTLPLTVLTFGLFLLAINAMMLQLVSAVVPGLRVRGFGTAFLGALLLTLLNVALASLMGTVAV